MEAVAQDIPLDIVYEDEHLVVVIKPVGMVVHPAVGHPDGTLVNALLHRFGQVCRRRSVDPASCTGWTAIPAG